MAGLVIATWNVENFSSEAEHFEAKLGYLGARLRQMDVDVIALQEVLDEKAARRLAAQLSCEVTLGLPDRRGNRVGFLTRTAPARVQVLSDWRLANGVLVQDLDANGRVVQLNQLSRPALKISVQHEDEEIDFIVSAPRTPPFETRRAVPDGRAARPASKGGVRGALTSH